MNDLIHKRCYNHRHREAAALCTECGRYFCRECITEHDDRVLCSSCLVKVTRRPGLALSKFSAVHRLANFCIGIVILWIAFYYLGQFLISIPSSFHEGTIWSSSWMEF